MAISQRLHTKLVQKLAMTPSLQQAIKLLPMTTLELSELLNQEMVENPMLEEVPTEELQPVEASPEKPDEQQSDKEKTDTWDDQDYEYFFGEYLDDGYRSRLPTEVKELPPIENTLSTAASLSDHLLWQLSMQSDDPLIRDIGEAIAGGDLRVTLDEAERVVAVLRNPLDRPVRFWVAPHLPTPHSAEHALMIRCLCTGETYEVPANGTWMRVLELGIRRRDAVDTLVVTHVVTVGEAPAIEATSTPRAHAGH